MALRPPRGTVVAIELTPAPTCPAGPAACRSTRSPGCASCLGFPTTAADDAKWAIFATAGTRFALDPRGLLAADITPDTPVGRPGFGGVTLAHNVRTRDEVDAALALAARATILKPACEAGWGGYSGYFADLDGHPWEVAWGEGWAFADDGTLWGGALGQPEEPG